MKKEEFLRRKNELKEKLRDTYIIVDEGIGCSLAMGCYFDHQVNKWKVFENGDRDTHYILLETSSEDEAFDRLNYMMMENILINLLMDINIMLLKVMILMMRQTMIEWNGIMNIM